MNSSNQYVVFTIDDRRFGLALESVKRIVHAVAVTPVSTVSELVPGIINLQGNIVPVVNLRCPFAFPSREIALDDLFVVVEISGREAVLVVDSVEGLVATGEQELFETEFGLPGAEFIQGVVKSVDQLIFIFNIEQFLVSLEVNVREGAGTVD